MAEHKCNKEWEIETLVKGFDEIKNLLLPSEYHPDNGLVNQFARQQKQLEAIKDQIGDIKTDVQKMKTTVSTAISVVGGVVVLIELALKFVNA